MQPNHAAGPENGSANNHVPAPSEAQNPISRPFTLQESLPYSPQTTTSPFLPEICPMPSVNLTRSALEVSGLLPRHEFDRLNREIAHQGHITRGAKQALDLVFHDLKSTQQKMNYQFAPVPVHSLIPSPNKSVSKDLSPFAKAVYDKVEGYFKATKAATASPQSARPDGEKPQTPSKDAAPLSPLSPLSVSRIVKARGDQNEASKPNAFRIEVAIPSRRNFDQSAYIDVATEQVQQYAPPFLPADAQQPIQQQPVQEYTASPQQDGLTSSSTPLQQLDPFSRPPSFRVELPAASIKKDEYLEVSYLPEAPQNLSSLKKGRSDLSYTLQEPMGGRVDQNVRVSEAQRDISALMGEIFQAAAYASLGERGFERMVDISADNQVTMNAFAQHKMHGAIQEVIGMNCYDQVPLEDLVRILELSDVKLKMVDNLSIQVDEEWDEAGVEALVRQLPDIETLLMTARTCVRMLIGCREEKEMYSEGRVDKCLRLLRMVTDGMVIPLVELRPSVGIFKMLFKYKKAIVSVFLRCQQLFAAFVELVTKVELSQFVVNMLEYTASKLIFVENASFDSQSVVGVQKFDGIRAVAMDMLGQIFLMKPEQRQGIIDEILSSLAKLPIGKQSSRRFEIADGESIQPVSALLMRLVQASSSKFAPVGGHGFKAGKIPGVEGDDEMDDEDSEDDDASDPQISVSKRAAPCITNEGHGAEQHAISMQELEAAAAPFHEDATRNASYIINFIVKRAIGSTKSGDTPYRNLLDLFLEDFTVCLDSPDWPSAELLLRLLMLMMVRLFEAGRTAAPTKNMALEILGSMSAALTRLRSRVKLMATPTEGKDKSELSLYLYDLATYALENARQVEPLISWTGPYRATLEYLQSRLPVDRYLANSISYLVNSWATQAHMHYETLREPDPEKDQELGRLAYRIRMMIEDHKWLCNEYSFKAVTAEQARLAYSILHLRSPLYESFPTILGILLGSMASDQATVRSKSLKSVSQVLETDPSILDGDSTVIQQIVDCSSDPSPQVRDSALGLLGSCIGMRPKLALTWTPRIIERFHDAGVQVRKRAMKLARDIYLRNVDTDIRSDIANGLFRRVQDPDDGVRDLACQIIEEIWFAPFYGNDSTAEYKTSLREHVALIIHSVKTGNVATILDKVLQTILKPKDRSSDGPFSVCSRLVADMFGLIDSSTFDLGNPSGRDALQVLTIFAKAEPKLFSFEQVKLLTPFLASSGGLDDLATFGAVTVIYQRVLAHLPTIVPEFLGDVRIQLLKNIGKISSRGALHDLVACTRVVSELLGDYAPLANVASSSLLQIRKIAHGTLDGRTSKIFIGYAIIVGSVGKHCDLEPQIDIFRSKFPNWKGSSVTQFIVSSLTPFASPKHPLAVRKVALEATGLVCQAWPRNYVRAEVYTAFQQAFVEQEQTLEAMILMSFKEFLLKEETRFENAGDKAADGEKRELTVMGGTNFDDVASATTQRFLGEITRIALKSQDAYGFLAMEVLGSINRQGLTHPKETGITLMTLATSTNRKLAELAFSEHRALHEKHETVLEREYMKAVRSIYLYQRDIVGDSHGASGTPPQSKLHMMMEVLRISRMKNRQRFLEKLCGQVDFDWTKLDTSGKMPPHVEYCRFIIENIAFLEYQTIGELSTTVNTVEKLFAATGVAVAQAIESEVFDLRVDAVQTDKEMTLEGGEPTAAPGMALVVEEGEKEKEDEMEIEYNGDEEMTEKEVRMRRYAASSMILLSLWEARSYLRRLYNMGTSKHDGKAKALAKDLNKTPVKVQQQGQAGEKFSEQLASHMEGLESKAKMKQVCKAFVELLNVDKELKLAVEDEEMELKEGPTSSEGEEDNEMVERGRKRKGIGGPGGRKKRARSSSQPRKRGRPRKQAVTEQQEGEEDEDEMDWS